MNAIKPQFTTYKSKQHRRKRQNCLINYILGSHGLLNGSFLNRTSQIDFLSSFFFKSLLRKKIPGSKKEPISGTCKLVNKESMLTN